MCAEIARWRGVIAREYGPPCKALPIIVSRRFHHSGLLCREDANIRKPKDLEGKVDAISFN